MTLTEEKIGELTAKSSGSGYSSVSNQAGGFCWQPVYMLLLATSTVAVSGVGDVKLAFKPTYQTNSNYILGSNTLVEAANNHISDGHVLDAIADIYQELLDGQTHLDEEASAVLYDNLWDLY